MSDRPVRPLYSVDTSSLMDWQARYYPTDVFVSLLDLVGQLIEAGLLRAPSIVHDEIKAVGTDDLKKWAATNGALFVPTATVLHDAQAIQNQFAGLRDPRAEYEEADAYVIALARQQGGIVVTQETSVSEKRNPKRSHYIPDVCRELGIPSISLLGLMRREGWKL